MMTNKERYKQAFAAVKPSGEIHMEVEKMSKTNYRSYRTVFASVICCCLLATATVTAYATNVGGIQRMIQVWIHGDLTDAVLEFNENEGTYSLDYTDSNGEQKHESGGGVGFNTDGTQRAATEEEVWDELNAPKIQYKDDDTVWMYYCDQKVNITDMFKDDVCYIQLIKDGKPWYLTIKYKNGYGASPNKYMTPNEFN